MTIAMLKRMNNPIIDIQIATKSPAPVSNEQLTQWASLCLQDTLSTTELTLRCVDAEEMIALNHRYRHQNKTTNVLAFPSHIPDNLQLESHFLGDVIICPSVLLEESTQLGKTLCAHWAHIVIHGILHLLNFDHETDEETVIMQQREIELLSKLGFANPYNSEDN